MDRDKIRDAWAFLAAGAKVLEERNPETAASYPAVGMVRLFDGAITVAKHGRKAFQEGLQIPPQGPISSEKEAEILAKIPEEDRKGIEPKKLVAAFRAGYLAEQYAKQFAGKRPQGSGFPF